MHYRSEINSELSDSQCAEIQSRKRFHYKNLIHAGKIVLRDGVLRLINELSNLDIKQFIVTTSGRDSLDPFLQTSLRTHFNYFSGLITYEDVIKHKPFPDAYQLAVQLSQESEVNCIAIEDSMIGVKAAKAANINCLMTLPPWSRSTQNIERTANACVNSLGNSDNPSKLIYGQKLTTNYVDFQYLTNIIN